MSWVEVVVGDLSKQPDQQLRRDWPSSIHSYPSTQFSLLTFLMTWSTAGGIFQSIVSPEKFVNKKEDNRSHDFADSTQKSLISLSFLETEWDSKGGNWVSNVSLEGWRVGGRCGGSRRRGGGGVRKRCACLKWCTKKDWMGVVVTFSLPVTTVTPPHLTLSVVDPSFTLRPPLHKSIWLLPLPDTDNEGY